MTTVRAVRCFVFSLSGHFHLLSSSPAPLCNFNSFSSLSKPRRLATGTSSLHTMDRFVKKSPRNSAQSKQSDPSPKKSHATRAGVVEAEIQAEKEKYEKMKLSDKRKLYKCGENFVTLDEIETWPAYAKSMKDNKKPRKGASKEPKFKVNVELNEKISLVRADITSLEIDAIVNAANNSLLGGGGVDGAIHSAAGPFLKRECSTLDGCDTGDAKITCGHKMPAKHIIHTVGPMGEKPDALRSAYYRSLTLIKENHLKSVAFPCISTGIYGYPIDAATHVALRTIREWLENEKYSQQVERIIMCLFLKKDVEVYEDLLKVYFPLPASDKDTQGDSSSASGEAAASSEAVEKGSESGDKRKGETDEDDETTPPKPRTPTKH